MTTPGESLALLQLQKAFNQTCNMIVPIAVENRCWNKVALHHLSYYKVRGREKDVKNILGSQMVCNSIKAVCDAYKVLKLKKDDLVPVINFKQSSSVHFDKRTYTLKNNVVSLYTLSGRIQVSLRYGGFQEKYLQKGLPTEAELIYRNKQWFFNLVLDIPDEVSIKFTDKVLGVDLGENNLAATSSGCLFGGGELRYKRDKALALRSRLQSNGTKSSNQLLKKTSGQESRHVKHINHVISKAIVEEAVATGCSAIGMEDLTNIRKRIKAGKRVRSRLHRWPWAQLQEFVAYKAEAAGLRVIFVNPAYTSQMCANCQNLGVRKKHRLVCNLCGIQRHSDLNASQNIRRIAASADVATGTVNYPHVANT